MRNMPETQDKSRNDRLEARVSRDQKELFQRAAVAKLGNQGARGWGDRIRPLRLGGRHPFESMR